LLFPWANVKFSEEGEEERCLEGREN